MTTVAGNLLLPFRQLRCPRSPATSSLWPQHLSHSERHAASAQVAASRKRKRPASPSDEVAFVIRDAARDADPLKALAAYDAAVAAGTALKPDSYSRCARPCSALP